MCSASPAWGRGWLCVGALVTRPCWRSLVPGFALELVTQRESGHNPSIIPIFFFLFILGFGTYLTRMTMCRTKPWGSVPPMPGSPPGCALPAPT